jgi:hypothetical protein
MRTTAYRAVFPSGLLGEPRSSSGMRAFTERTFRFRPAVTRGPPFRVFPSAGSRVRLSYSPYTVRAYRGPGALCLRLPARGAETRSVSRRAAGYRIRPQTVIVSPTGTISTGTWPSMSGPKNMAIDCWPMSLSRISWIWTTRLEPTACR